MAVSQQSDYQFVDTPSSMLTCCVCRHVSCDPQLSVCCGYLFCTSCLDNITVCPNTSCDKELTVVPNKQADRAIKALLLFCTNKVKGCQWKGPLSELDNHFSNCKFVRVECSRGCGIVIPKESVDVHMRDNCPFRPDVCQYCFTTGTHHYITGEHQEECLSELVPCPNNCEVEGVLRRGIKMHKDVCSLERVECQFQSIGCEELVVRKDFKQHNKERLCKHLCLTNDELFKLQNEIEASVDNVDKNTKEKLDEIEAELNSTQKQLDGLLGGWSVRINAMAASKLLENAPVILRLVNFSNSGGVLRTARSLRTGYVARRRMSEKGCCSNPFLSHEAGYKMFLKFTPVSSVLHDSYQVTLHLMEGPNDAQLSWPLKGIFEVTLLNQISDCAHHSTMIIYDSSTPVVKASRVTGNTVSALTRSEGWGNLKFISHHDLHQTSPTCQFLKDDCLFFQVCKLE